MSNILLNFSKLNSVNSVLTQYDILSQVSDEDIMRKYLKRELNGGLFVSPFREDKHPTCSLYRNQKGVLYFKDFGSGDHLNCFGVVMKLYNISFQAAINKIALDFGITGEETQIFTPTIQIEKKKASKIQVELKEFSKEELDWWNSYGITRSILSNYKVYSCNTIFLNDKIYALNKKEFAFGYFGGTNGNFEYWRIYKPLNKDFRFISNWPKNKIQGFDQLKYNTDFLVITKSLKDVMCLRALGIEAIAPNSEGYFIPDSMYSNLKTRYSYILLLYDNDYAGITYANKIRKQYPDLIPIIIPRKTKAKDISDFRKMYGKEKTFKGIYKMKLWLQDKMRSIILKKNLKPNF